MITKYCKTCKETKPNEDFWIHATSKDGLDYHCKSCKRDKLNNYKRSDLAIRNSTLKKYGIDHNYYLQLYKKQDGKCAICGSDKNNSIASNFAVDHCHESGKVRGLLCSNCNTALGLFKDDVNRLKSAINYLTI